MGKKKKWYWLGLSAIVLAVIIGWGIYAGHNVSRYCKADAAAANGDYEVAQYLFRAQENYRDSAERELFCLRQRLADAKVGDIFTLGLCVQSGETQKLPIEWQILRVDGSHIVAIAKLALYSLPYNIELQEVDWARCTLRKWLNEVFYNQSFTAAEKTVIAMSQVDNPANGEFNVPGGPATQDSVYVLSLDEVKHYMPTPEARLAQASDYAMKHGGRSNLVNSNVWWWLRSPGSESNCASRVCVDGTIDDLGVHNFNVCVRPVVELQY